MNISELRSRVGADAARLIGLVGGVGQALAEEGLLAALLRVHLRHHAAAVHPVQPLVRPATQSGNVHLFCVEYGHF